MVSFFWFGDFCSQATGKSYFFHTNHMLGAPDFTGSEHCMGALHFSLEHSLGVEVCAISGRLPDNMED